MEMLFRERKKNKNYYYLITTPHHMVPAGLLPTPDETHAVMHLNAFLHIHRRSQDAVLLSVAHCFLQVAGRATISHMHIKT